jgi:glyceraldehyde 3-phosphate dehydrogenase
MLRVGINGFGRIGRLAARIILENFKNKLELVCINTSGRIEANGWAYLFEHDSAYGKYQGKVSTSGNNIIVDNKKIPVLGETDPETIPWSQYKTQVVIESTGVFRKEKDAQKHLKGTVKKVILSAPGKDGDIPMFVIGVNEQEIADQPVISCASCTTNCVAPVVKVLDTNFKILKGLMTTIHAYTSDQQLLDGSHKDLRRARSAAVNIIPTTTGAARATGSVYPPVKGSFDGLAIRVPVITGSLVDFTLLTAKKVTVKQVNQALEKASQEKLKNILKTTYKPIVSTDIIGLNASALVDLSLTNVIKDDLVKVVAWYDNEWGYANRLVEETILLGNKL